MESRPASGPSFSYSSYRRVQQPPAVASDRGLSWRLISALDHRPVYLPEIHGAQTIMMHRAQLLRRGGAFAHHGFHPVVAVGNQHRNPVKVRIGSAAFPLEPESEDVLVEAIRPVRIRHADAHVKNM